MESISAHSQYTLESPSRSRAPEFYGFVAWTSTSLGFCLYLLWALVPDEYIVWAGIEWYPSREWALLIPAWSIMLVVTTYIVYSAMAIAATPSFSDMNAITDARTQFPTGDVPNPYLNADPSSPMLYDIPIGLVNRVLYHRLDEDEVAESVVAVEGK